MIKRWMRRPVTWVALVVVLSAGLYWFQPWRLVTIRVVTEQLSAPVVPTPSAAASASASAAPAAPTGPVVVRQGEFITHEHETTGQARLVRNPDGSHQLELAGLATSDGPDLRVWLTDQEVRTGTAGWKVFDDGKYVELGKLKGNKGDQIYRLPAGTNPEAYQSVSIWCKRFAVSFGAAALTKT